MLLWETQHALQHHDILSQMSARQKITWLSKPRKCSLRREKNRKEKTNVRQTFPFCGAHYSKSCGCLMCIICQLQRIPSCILNSGIILILVLYHNLFYIFACIYSCFLRYIYHILRLSQSRRLFDWTGRHKRDSYSASVFIRCIIDIYDISYRYTAAFGFLGKIIGY